MPIKGEKVYSSDKNKIIPINDLYIGEWFKDITQNIVPDIYDYYIISNFGRIYNKYTGIFLKPGISGAGYHFIYLSTYNGQKMMQVHRLLMLTFFPIQNPELYQVNHKDGNKLNNTVLNLEWCTRSENIIHSYEKLSRIKSNVIINEDIANKVCELLSENKYTDEEIAKSIGNGVTKHIVQDIKSGTSWKNISKNYTFKHRPGKLFTDEMIHNICKYFSNNQIGKLTVNEHSKNALKYYGYDYSDNMIDSTRKIYTRKYYTNISKNYNF